MRARRHTGSIVTLLLLGAACTGGVEPETRTTTAPPDRPLAGTVVGPSGIGSDGGRVVVHDLATGETRPIGGGGFEGRTFVNSVAVDADGRHYVVADTALGEFDPLFGGEFESRLYLLGADGAVERIGPPLPAVGSLVGIEDGVAIATACDEESPSVIALDLGRPEGWRPLGPGCVASLSPDGKHVAAAGQGEGSRDRVVRFATGEPGPAELLVDLASLEEIGSVAAIGDPRVEGIEWGARWIAVLVADGEGGRARRYAIVLVDRAGAGIRVVALGFALVDSMAWQPGGELLAFSSCATDCRTFFRGNPRSDVRILDPATGALRQLVASTELFPGVAWSPQGDVLVTLARSGQLVFLAPDGTAVAVRDQTLVPWSWTA